MALETMNICEGIETPIIRFRGVFDWLELYRVIKNWIASERFTPQEKKYKHKKNDRQEGPTNHRTSQS